MSFVMKPQNQSTTVIKKKQYWGPVLFFIQYFNKNGVKNGGTALGEPVLLSFCCITIFENKSSSYLVFFSQSI